MSPYIRNMKASMKEQLKRVGPLETGIKNLKSSGNTLLTSVAEWI